MNRSDLERALSNEGVPDSTTVVGKLIKILTISLSAGEPINIRNFGKLELRERAPITRKNPITGEPFSAPARNTVVFQPSPHLKERVNR